MQLETWTVSILVSAALVAAVAMWELVHGTHRRAGCVVVPAERRSRRTPFARRTLILLALAAVPLSLAIPGSTLPAQAVRYGVLMDLPRTQLERTWSDDPRQLERAYCIVNYSTATVHVSRAPVEDDSVFRVWAVNDAPVNSAGPNSVDFECPQGVPELHTHTPSTCSGDDVRTCVAGGLNAYSCQPSRQDLEKLVRRGDPFAVIQCDQRAFRFYYPTEYVPTQTQLAAGAGSNKPDATVPLVMQKRERPGKP